MMDWTDRHCRYFLRGFSADVLLYTEMLTAPAILRGDGPARGGHTPLVPAARLTRFVEIFDRRSGRDAARHAAWGVCASGN